MPIGRLVPLYTIEMMQNNRAKISCSQLTRFLTMSAPVMQNFEITFGAFFCPYLALDDYFVHSKARGNSGYPKYDAVALHANEFYDPSTTDSERVHPMSKSVKFLNADALKAGSLIDHLQYKIFQEIDKSLWAMKMNGSDDINVSSWPELNNPYVLGLEPNSARTDATWPSRSSGTAQFASLYEDVNGAITYDVPLVFAFVLNSPFFDGTLERGEFEHILLQIDSTYSDKSSISYSMAVKNGVITTYEDSLVGRVAKNIWTDFKADYDSAHRKYFEGMTQTIAWSNIVDWYTTRLIYRTHGDFSANVTRWLVYQRIYSDYFLPDEYVDCERYRAMIGDAYFTAANNNASTLASVFTAGNGVTNNQWITDHPNDPVTWYAPYIRKGECMPVLWDMNQFTALKPKDDKGDPTAIGSSVEQNFYQRQLARFKGLVRRMGFDVQNNLDSIYGGHVNDETLRKSQVIGFKKFDVSIGDVAKTSSDGVDKNFGDFAGYAVSKDSMGAFDWTANQNGMLMICAYIRPKFTAIVNSIPRDMIKTSYFDYLLPQFGGVGYQDVTYKQLSPNGKQTHDNAVFGKQEIYSEYMSVDNECSGRMATDCRHYNMDRIVPSDIKSLTDPKNLGFLYMTEADDLNRCFVDKENDPCLISAFFTGNVTRQLPSTIRVEY